jgi:archaellum component FlaC
MNERDELQQLNESLKRLESNLSKLNSAIVGDEFNKDGILIRIECLEKKVKKIDNLFYIFMGAVTIGAYPFLKPFIEQWFKN